MSLVQAARVLGGGGMRPPSFQGSQSTSLAPHPWPSTLSLRQKASNAGRQRLDWRPSHVPWAVVPRKCGQVTKKRQAPARAFARDPPKQVVEHVVLFKMKEDARAEQAFEGLQTLKSLDVVEDLSASRVQQVVGGQYTHALHSRHADRAALGAYATHPSHVAVVQKLHPFMEDAMAVDWEAVPSGKMSVEGGYRAARITLMKMVEDATEEEFSNLFDSLNDLADKFSAIKQISVGPNFSPARAKGFNVGFAAMFDDAEELRYLDESSQLHGHLGKSRSSPFLESFVVVDINV